MADAQSPGVLPTPLGRTSGNLPANGDELADSGHRGEEALRDHPVAPPHTAATESEALPVKTTLDGGTASSSNNSASTPEVIHPRKESIFGRLLKHKKYSSGERNNFQDANGDTHGPARVLFPVEQSGSPSDLVLSGRPEMDREINGDEPTKSKNDTHLATDPTQISDSKSPVSKHRRSLSFGSLHKKRGNSVEEAAGGSSTGEHGASEPKGLAFNPFSKLSGSLRVTGRDAKSQKSSDRQNGGAAVDEVLPQASAVDTGNASAIESQGATADQTAASNPVAALPLISSEERADKENEFMKWVRNTWSRA